MRRAAPQRWIRTIALFACLPVSLAAQRPIRARIVGTVYDSIAKHGLSGAMVRIVRADDPSVGRSVTSDALGGFVYDSVPAGTWLASFLHPMLD